MHWGSKTSSAARYGRFALGLSLLAGGATSPVAAQSEADAVSAKTWLGSEAKLEEFLKTAEPVELEPIGTGVTNPFRAVLEPGGLMEAFAWKPIAPGRYSGHLESYETEVAAYELDKLLELGMVPVTVERRVDRELGAACMWLGGVKSFKELGGPPRPPARLHERWNIQLIRAKMFDNLILNKDPNLGNWLVDSVWNVILIDHSRSFGIGRMMSHELSRFDPDLWERMKKLDEASLGASVGQYLSRKQIQSVLRRRDRMKEMLEELVAKNGEEAVTMRYKEPIR